MDSPAEFSTNVTTTKVDDSENISMSEFSCQQPHAENVPTSELAHDINQELVDLHFPQASFLGDTTVYVVVSGMLTFLSPDVLTLLERQTKNRADFLMSKDKEKKTKSFQNQFKLKYQLNPAGKILQSVTDQQDSAISLPFGSSTGKPADLNMSQQPPCLKTIEDQFQKNCMQLFWGLPCLHSESLRPTVCASGDCPSYFTCFNSIFKASIAHEPTVVLHFTASSSPEIQYQALPEPLPQFPFPHVPLNQFQAQLQSPLPVLPPSSLSQPRSCGVCFHSPQSEAQSLTVPEIHHLEYHVLQKQQESMWGLPTVVQRSQERFCSPAPKLASASRSSKAYVPISILSGDFPLDSALRGKLEYHLRKRLIQHRWGLPHRVFESLSKMRLYREIPQTSESESSHGLSWISFYKHESCKDLNYALRNLRNFDEKLCNGSETLPLENRVEKELGHSLEIGPNNHLLSHLQGAPDNSLGRDTKTEVECHAGDISGFSGTFGVSLCQIKSKDALEVHLSKKFEEINEGQVPDVVQNSWHSTKMTLPLPKKSSSEINQSDLTQLMSQGKNKDSSLNTPQGVSPPDSSKHEILEDHIKIFHGRMTSGLPQRAQESIDMFNVKKDPSNSFPYWNTFHGVMEGRTNSFVDSPPSATSPVSGQGQGDPKESPSYNKFTTHTTENGTPTTFLPHTYNNIQEASQIETALVNRHRSELTCPTKQAGTGCEIMHERMRISNDIEKLQSKTTRNLVQFPKSNKSREIFKAKELHEFQSRANTILKTNESESSPIIAVNPGEVGTTLNTKRSSVGTSVSHDPEQSAFKDQLIRELKLKLESRKQSQAQELPAHVPLASDASFKTLITRDQCVSSGDKVASQVLHVQLNNKGISMQPEQEPWVPKHVSRKCQDKNVPPAVKKPCLPAPKTGELGGGDAGLVISQTRRKSCQPEDRASKMTLGRNSSSTLSLKRQPPPENSFKNQMKQFFQFLCPGAKEKSHGSFLGKGSSPSTSMQGRDPGKGRAAFSMNTKNQNLLTNVDKVNKVIEKLGQKHTMSMACPQVPLTSSRKSEKTEHKAELKVQAEPLRDVPSIISLIIK
jgi:hypothetical protein